MSKKQASGVFGISQPTIIFRFSNKFLKKEHGPSPILTKDEEQTIVDWLSMLQKKVFQIK